MELSLPNLAAIAARQAYRDEIARAVTRDGVIKQVDRHVVEFYGSKDPYGSWFSNLCGGAFMIDGTRYTTSEQYYQIQKFIMPEDDPAIYAHCREHNTDPRTVLAALREHREKMMRLNGMFVARAGRTRQLPMRSDWDDARYVAMWTALVAKFMQNDAHRERLLGTGDAVLIERSPRDAFWGCVPRSGGENVLGRMLMDLRARLAV